MINRSIDEIKAQIDKIKSIDLELVDFNSILNEIIILMREYTCVQFPASNNEVFRVRINERGKTGEFELYTKVENLWVPKPEVMPKNKFGRANKPQNPVFYCSNSEETTISESPIQEGDWITVMHCQNKKEPTIMKTIGLGFSNEDRFKSKDGKEFINWGKHKQEKISSQYKEEYKNNKIVEENISKNSLIDKFLNEEFRRRVNSDSRNFEYKITAAVASLYLDNPVPNSQIHDGICYPSVYGQKSSPNWAFTVKAANEFYKPFYFETIEIGKIIKENNKTQYCGNSRFKSIEITLSGDIRWEKNKLFSEPKNE